MRVICGVAFSLPGRCCQGDQRLELAARRCTGASFLDLELLLHGHEFCGRVRAACPWWDDVSMIRGLGKPS